MIDLKKYQKQLKKEALLNSALISLRWTGLTLIICSIVWWCFGLGLIWLIPIIAAAGYIVVFNLDYVRRSPALKEVARRIDELGLEERVATAIELEGNDSYIAKRQREDTEKALKKLNKTTLKMRIYISTIILTLVAIICAGGSTAVSVLAYKGAIPTLPQIIGEKEPTAKYYKVEFAANKGGSIWGERSQIVYEGETSLAVMAVADTNYYFTRWSDGNTNPFRIVEPQSNIKLIAYFAEVDNYDPDNDKDNNPYPNDLPLPGDKEKDNNGTPNPNPNPSTEGNGRYNENNKYLDGEHNYQDDLDDAIDKAKDTTNNDKNLDGGDRDIIDNYFNGIKN
jgi:hypothetical protein